MTETRPASSIQPQQTSAKASSSGILKFINEQNSASRPQGKKCNPYRQFGISSDAPAEFCTKNSLVSDMARYKQAKAKQGSQPEYYSQKNFFTVGHTSQPKPKAKPEQNNFISQYNESCSQNKVAFHRNSSKISKFYENNAWMGNRFYVMGHQRSEKALQIAKTNVEINMRSTRSLNFSKKRSMTPATSTRTFKLFPTHQSMKELFMAEKSRIREMRNMLASQPLQQFDIKRPRTSFQYTRARSNDMRGQMNSERKPREFEINVPQWGQKDFNVRFIEWNPEKAKESPTLAQTQTDQAPSSSRKFFS